MTDDFKFLDPGELVDGDLQLVLAEKDCIPTRHHGVPFYRFEMRRAGDEVLMGGMALRIGHPETVLRYAGHLGFSVQPEYRGHRYAARSVRLLLPFARRHGLQFVWIGCAHDNAASRRTCELAGATYYETVPVPDDTDLYQQGIRFLCRYYIDL